MSFGNAVQDEGFGGAPDGPLKSSWKRVRAGAGAGAAAASVASVARSAGSTARVGRRTRRRLPSRWRSGRRRPGTSRPPVPFRGSRRSRPSTGYLDRYPFRRELAVAPGTSGTRRPPPSFRSCLCRDARLSVAVEERREVLPRQAEVAVDAPVEAPAVRAGHVPVARVDAADDPAVPAGVRARRLDVAAAVRVEHVLRPPGAHDDGSLVADGEQDVGER